MINVVVFCSCDTIDKLKSKLPLLEKDINDSTKFKDFYQFTFNYAKNPGKLFLSFTVILLLLIASGCVAIS